MMIINKALSGAFVAGIAALALAPGAWAGEYHAYSCRMPSGASAPADGWSPSVKGVFDDYAENTCGQAGGALIAALGDLTPHFANIDQATWTFSVPASETMAGATLWRAGDADGGEATNATYEFWLAGPSENGVFYECVYEFGCHTGVGNSEQALSSTNRIVIPSANLGSHIYSNAACGGIKEFECQSGHGDANHYAAVVYLYAADIVLEQGAGPTANNVGGELASAPAVSGMSDVTFSATDPGSGVYEAIFNVDGQVAQSTVVNENGGRCRNVGQTTDGLAAFLYLQPCPQAVSADVPFDTMKVSNGVHHLIVSVIDAAGNSAPVLDREIMVANPAPRGPANGANASEHATLTARWKGTTKERLTRGYGHRSEIVGRLTAPEGASITGAQIEVTDIPAYDGAKARAMTSARTGPNGSWSVKLPKSISSGTLTIAYRSNLGDALPVATRTLTLSVRAGVSLSVAPRTASVGWSIFFKGVLKGTPLPAGGKQLVLEARSAEGEWIEFDVIRTGRHGRFHSSYRFKFPGPASYQFRAVCKQEADFPFMEGASNVVRVRER